MIKWKQLNEATHEDIENATIISYKSAYALIREFIEIALFPYRKEVRLYMRAVWKQDPSWVEVGKNYTWTISGNSMFKDSQIINFKCNSCEDNLICMHMLDVIKASQ